MLHIEISLLLCVIWLFVSQKIRKDYASNSHNTRPRARIHANQLAEMDKIHAMQLFIKVAELESFS
ncbi:hypothetical protein ACUOCP_23010, partial [Escherichia sp. R-CC3]